MPAVKPGTVIHHSALPDGREVIIRYVKLSDAPVMPRYINALSKERTFVTFQGEQLTLKQERAMVARHLKKVSARRETFLLMLVGKEIAGISGIHLEDHGSSHVGSLGISIAKKFRGGGLGKFLMKTVLNEAAKLPGIRMVQLTVYGTNSVARALYRSFGFKDFGKLPGGIFHRGRYVDRVYMYKRLDK